MQRSTALSMLPRSRLSSVCSSLIGSLLLAPCVAAADPFPLFTEFRQVEGIYEPSAAQQMPDGRIFVVEDEIEHSIAIISIQEDGTFAVQRLDPAVVFAAISDGADAEIPEDLEGIAVDDEGFVYIITSHSREDDGVAYPRREKLVRFKVEGDQFTEMAAYSNLKTDIAAKHPLLAQSTEITDVKNEGGLNIEGIAFDKNKDKLLVGFRSPLSDGKAVLVTVENPKSLFDEGAEAEIGEEMILLDFDDNGVRGMVYDPTLNGYLLISGPVNRDRTLNFRLWFWSGTPGEEAVPVHIPGPVDAINRGECVSPIVWQDKEMLLLIRDDGKKKKERGAHYIFLNYDQVLMGDK